MSGIGECCGLGSVTLDQIGFSSPLFSKSLVYSLHILLGAQDQRLGAEQDQLPCWSTETSSVNCQKTETCMFWACHMPRQPLQNHPLRHLGGRAMPWSAEEMLDEQHQRADIPAYAKIAGIKTDQFLSVLRHVWHIHCETRKSWQRPVPQHSKMEGLTKTCRVKHTSIDIDQYLSVLRQTAGLTRMSHTLTADWDTVKTIRVVGQYFTRSTVLGWPPSDCNSFPVTRSHTLVVRSAAKADRETKG